MPTLQKVIETILKTNTLKLPDQFKDSTYISHLIRIMVKQDSNDAKIVAILHDIIYTNITTQDLKNSGFSQTIIEAILSITMTENESHNDFIKRIKNNDIGRMVKITDIEDDLHYKIARNDKIQIKKYKDTLDFLNQ